jgi:hypothetical protein
MIPADARTPEALAAFLRSNGVEASAIDDATAVAFRARNETAASRTAFAVVCHLAAESYRAEATWWIRNRDSSR